MASFIMMGAEITQRCSAIAFHGALTVGIITLLTACHTPPPPDSTLARDLVRDARQWRQDEGLAEARDQLAEALMKLDSDQGRLERRMWATNADKALVFPDSLATVSRERRASTGVYLVLGYQTRSRRSEKVIRHAADYLIREGWNAHLVPVPDRGTCEQDALAIQDFLRRELPKVDRAILIGFSKGGGDWMHWFAHHAEELPAAERQKLRLFMTFAGALRGSSLARWLMDDRDPLALLLRNGMVFGEGRETYDTSLRDLHSVAADPWLEHAMPQLKTVAPRLQSVSMVALGGSKSGGPSRDFRFTTVGGIALRRQPWSGPTDGVVESAAEVLPVSSGVPQQVIRVYGAHGIIGGRYANGAEVTPGYRPGRGEYWRGSEPLMDDLIRALPKKLAGF